jgi:hypothetical protein
MNSNKSDVKDEFYLFNFQSSISSLDLETVLDSIIVALVNFN